jgi:hypothetical protein
MSTLAIITSLTGILLGVRFKVLILVPSVALAVVAVFAGGIAHHEETGSIAVALLLAAVGLQVGYLGGLSASRAVMVIGAFSGHAH